MRNLAQYPITDAEIITALEEALDNMKALAKAEELIGDVTPVALQTLLARLRRASGTLPPTIPAKVIPYRGITRLNLPVERVLEMAKEAELEGVVILGYTKDGDEYAASSYASGDIVVWLLERTKHRLLAVSDGENYS